MSGNGAASDRGRVEAVVAELCARGAGLVTLDADGVLWREDAGSRFLVWQIENNRLPAKAEREARDGWDAHCRGELNDLALAILCATCLRGLPEELVEADARNFFERHIRHLIVPETQDWARRLQEAGVAVWVVSGSHRWIVSAGARAVGIPQDRLLAVETVVRDGLLSPEVMLPVPFGVGKAKAIRQRLGRCPDLAAGNMLSDRAMLELAELPVAVEPEPALAAFATERGWPVVRFPASPEN